MKDKTRSLLQHCCLVFTKWTPCPENVIKLVSLCLTLFPKAWRNSGCRGAFHYIKNSLVLCTFWLLLSLLNKSEVALLRNLSVYHRQLKFLLELKGHFIDTTFEILSNFVSNSTADSHPQKQSQSDLKPVFQPLPLFLPFFLQPPAPRLFFLFGQPGSICFDNTPWLYLHTIMQLYFIRVYNTKTTVLVTSSSPIGWNRSL